MGLTSRSVVAHGRDSRNRVSDQKIVQDLLNRIPASAGGTEGLLNERMVEGICSNKLFLAILNFQKKNLPQFADGHVDPDSRSTEAMERLAKIHDLAVSAIKARSDAAEKAARDKAAIDHAVDQMLGDQPGSETWNVGGADAPLSGAFLSQLAQASHR